MSEVIPRVFAGKNRVLVSETVYFDSRLPLTIAIPTTDPDRRPGPDLNLEFVFKEGTAQEGKKLKIEVDKSKIRFLLWEFHQLTAGTTKPVPFKFGGADFSIAFFASSFGKPESKEICFTFSLFEGTFE